MYAMNYCIRLGGFDLKLPPVGILRSVVGVGIHTYAICASHYSSQTLDVRRERWQAVEDALRLDW